MKIHVLNQSTLKFNTVLENKMQFPDAIW